MLFGEVRQGITHLFYPRLCEGCNKPLVGAEDILCVACGMELPETGYHHIADNDTASRFAGRVPFVHATSLAWFTNEGLLQHLLHGLKYRNKKDIGLYLGCLLGNRIKAAGWGNNIDMVVPVPLHRKKQAKRGYNQSMLVAEGIADALGKPASTSVLERVRNTETQTNKTRTERIANMADAFAFKPGISIAGKHLLLCDDMLTTGATMEACAIALLRHDNIKISFATIGIAVP